MRTDTVPDGVLQLLGGPDVDLRALYYRWEQEQWQAGAIDLVTDARSWSVASAGMRRRLETTFAWHHAVAATTTGSLVALADAAPDEEQQVFLTTQMVDQARHLVFFDRIRTEVMGDLRPTPDERIPGPPDRSSKALLGRAEAAGERVRAAQAADVAALVEAVVLHHLCVAGLVHAAHERSLDAVFQGDDSWAGLREGFTLIGRDVVRHVAFGLLFLRDMLEREPALVGELQEVVEQVWPFTVDALDVGVTKRSAGATRDANQAPARAALEAWLKAVDLEVAVPG